MASLVLSGDTSGSVTLAAPAVAGSTTQTLVDVTGTLAPIVSGTAITLTNQTAPEFTGIPSWVKRITLMFSGVSTNGSGQVLVQLGDAGGYETSGYLGTTGYNASYTNYSSGFTIDTASSVSAATIRYGAMILNYVGSNIWVVCGTGGTGGSASYYFGGTKTLSDTLTSVRLFIDGTQQFDAGSINILYE